MTAATPRLPVLVIDDDSALIHTLSDILRIHGYAPVAAATAREGLRLAAQHPPALAVVDLRLPDMAGVELIARLHALSEMTEVVVLTGNASVDTAIEALREHSIDYLLKPLQVDQLLHAVSVAGERWQRRHAEYRLQKSEERYRMLFDGNPQPMWVYDLESLRFLAVNEVAIDTYGFSRNEFLAMTIAAIRPAEDVSAMIAAVRSPTIQAARLWRHRRKTGEIIHVDVTTRDLDFEGRKARLVLAVDVSDRVSVQHALEVRARQQEAVALFGQRALAADDVATLFEDATRLLVETLDVPFAGVFERQVEGAHLVLRAGHGWPATAVGEFRAPISSHSQAGYSLLHRMSAVVSDYRSDDRFPASRCLREHGIVSGMSVPIPGPVHPFGVLTVHATQARSFTQDDVHFLQAIGHSVGTAVERSITDAALRQAQRLEAVGRLAGGIAHDFNNVLTAINGYGEMLRGSLPEDDPRREDIEEMLAASGRASGLTKQLLAFSRKQVLEPRILDLNEVVSDTEKMLQRLLGADIQFSTALAPDLGPVLADAGQLGQVILNLCINARDAMPDGGSLTVETSNVELDASSSREHALMGQGACVMLAVSDTGTGMDAETQARIFEPFFTTKGADHGTGLGLATVYGIVKQSGGDIRVYSESGHGTVFRVFLPRVENSSIVEGR